MKMVWEKGKTDSWSDCSLNGWLLLSVPLQVPLFFPGNQILSVSPPKCCSSPLDSAGSSLQGQQINLAITPPFSLPLFSDLPSLHLYSAVSVTFSWLHFKLRNGNINHDYGLLEPATTTGREWGMRREKGGGGSWEWRESERKTGY